MDQQLETITVGPRHQVTLPASLIRRMNVRAGDVFEVQTAQTMLILSHKSFVDTRIDEGIADIREGRTHGPFSTADTALAFLHKRKKTQKQN